MRRATRKEIQAWLHPMRTCFAQMRTGEVDAIRGYPVTRLNDRDEYARVDYCLAGFRALIQRLCNHIDAAPLERIEKKLASGTPLTVPEIDGALTLLKQCETALIKHSREAIKDAVLTEQIVIEMDEIERRKAA